MITYTGPGFGARVTTTLNLVCAPGGTDTTISLVSTDYKTTWAFQMKHQDACPTSSCALTDSTSGALWDVSGLEDATYAFTTQEIIKGENVTLKVALAICSRAQNTQCDPDSAVCFVVPSIGQVLSGGSVYDATFALGVKGNPTSVLTYYNGKLCDAGSTTVINFHCSLAAGKGMPVYTGFDAAHCQASFSWTTAFACQMNNVVHANEYLYQLGLACGTFNAVNTVAGDPNSYALSLCAPATGPCTDAGVCEVDSLFNRPASAGSWDERSYEVAPGTSDVVVSYSGGALSDVGIPVSSVIHMYCNRSAKAGPGTPEHTRYDDERSIHYFSWTSVAGCPIQVMRSTATSSMSPTISHSRTRTPSQTPTISLTASPSPTFIPTTPPACQAWCGVAIGAFAGLGLLLALSIYIAVVLYKRLQRIVTADAESRKALVPNASGPSGVIVN